MRTSSYFFLLFAVTVQLYSQQTIKISDLELPNAPAFTLLDNSTTTISSPTTTQALTLSLLNAASASNGFPTDYALEFTPYWVFQNKSRNFNDYYENETKKSYSKPYKNLSFSMATVKKDTIQNVSVGIKTNLLTINRADKIAAINTLNTVNLVNFATLLDDAISPIHDPHPSGSKESQEWQLAQINALETNATYIDQKKKIYDMVDEINALKPVFSIDVATAYNHFFDQNEFKSGKFGRFGAWMTMNGNFRFENKKNYLCLYQYTRFLVNEMNFNPETLSYDKDKSLDVGAKVEFQLNDLAVGYEYIVRTSESDNYRSVGSIKYKVNDKITLNGGFGKNFEATDNLVSFFGISWGITANNEINVK